MSPASPSPSPSSGARLTAPLRGALWMLLAAACFALMTALVRKAGETLHPFEIAFFRNLFGLAFMMPWLMRWGFGALRTARPGGHALRGLIGLGAMLLWFSALTMMPLGEAVALSFTAPLFAALAAVLVLGERMGVRRSLALVAGFAGTLIILRPGLIAVSTPALLVLAASLFIACSLMMVKILSRTESPAAIVTWMGLYMTPLSAIPAIFVWRWPTLMDLVILLAMGGFGAAGQIVMTRAYAVTDVTVMLPFDYARLPFTALIGFVAFGEAFDGWTWAGAGVIAAATIYIVHRESRLATPEGPRIGTASLGVGGAELVPPPAARGGGSDSGAARR